MADILVIDSSTNQISVAAGTSAMDFSSKSIDQPSSHSENILSCVDQVLADRSSSMSSISAIGVGIGPGLFTGLRVGISAAHAFAHALNLPLVYFSSLELSVISTIQTGLKSYNEILVAKDARRSELYYAKYEFIRCATSRVLIDGVTFASNMRRIEKEQLISPKEFVQRVNQSQDGVTVLDDMEKYMDYKSIDAKRIESVLPAKIDTKYGLDLVSDAIISGVSADIFSPKALYIRKSDAELSWGKP